MFDFDMFRDRFVEYRKDNKLSQEEYAELLNVSVTTVKRIEQSVNVPTTEVIVNFLNLLKTNVSSFCGEDTLKDQYYLQLFTLISQLNPSEKELFKEIISAINVFKDGD